ncbi:MAG: response regulator [Bacillota bacterium]
MIKNILIVDDVNLIRMKLKNMMNTEGYRVFEAGSVKAVINQTFSNEIKLAEIDLALLDLYIKGEDGFELLRFFKSNYPDIKVVIVSMEARKEKIKKAISLGAVNYITKPFDKKTLLQKVNLILASNKQYSRKITAASKDYSDDISNLKTDLSLEVSRSIRSKKSFAVAKLNYPDSINNEKVNKLKSNITTKIRDIDRVYNTGSSEYTFLLPLTDREGVEKFTSKILSEIDEKITGIKNNIQISSIVFPAEIVGENSIDYDNHNKYIEKLLNNLNN